MEMEVQADKRGKARALKFAGEARGRGVRCGHTRCSVAAPVDRAAVARRRGRPAASATASHTARRLCLSAAAACPAPAPVTSRLGDAPRRASCRAVQRSARRACACAAAAGPPRGPCAPAPARCEHACAVFALQLAAQACLTSRHDTSAAARFLSSAGQMDARHGQCCSIRICCRFRAEGTHSMRSAGRDLWGRWLQMLHFGDGPHRPSRRLCGSGGGHHRRARLRPAASSAGQGRAAPRGRHGAGVAACSVATSMLEHNCCRLLCNCGQDEALGRLCAAGARIVHPCAARQAAQREECEATRPAEQEARRRQRCGAVLQPPRWGIPSGHAAAAAPCGGCRGSCAARTPRRVQQHGARQAALAPLPLARRLLLALPLRAAISGRPICAALVRSCVTPVLQLWDTRAQVQRWCLRLQTAAKGSRLPSICSTKTTAQMQPACGVSSRRKATHRDPEQPSARPSGGCKRAIPSGASDHECRE
jgi:hypothetical protein